MNAQQMRNAALDEAANELDIRAGEFLNNGSAFHACATIIRGLRTCDKCGKKFENHPCPEQQKCQANPKS